MFTEVGESLLTTRKFQKASIFQDHQGNIYAVLGFINNKQNKYDDEQIDTFSHDTFIRKDNKLLTIPGATLFDTRPLGQNYQCTQSWKECRNTAFLFQTQSKGFKSFLKQNGGQFRNNWVDIVEDHSYDAKLFTPTLILKVSENMKRLSVQNLKWNEENCDIRQIRPKKQTKFIIKKAMKNDSVFDVEDSPYQDCLIASLCRLNQSQTLFHLSQTQYNNRNNFSLLSYDVDYHQVNWKYSPSKYIGMTNTILLLNNKKVFLNGCYNFKNNVMSLNLFDLRVSGIVSNLIRSDSNNLIQLQRTQRIGSIYPDLQYLSHTNNEYQIITILSYGGGSKVFHVWQTYESLKIFLLQNWKSIFLILEDQKSKRRIKLQRYNVNIIIINLKVHI